MSPGRTAGRRAIEVVALDADDTLWHSEVYFERTQRRFTELVSRYTDPDVDVDAALAAAQHRNLQRYGYGIKGFTLSMIECAIEVTDGAILIDYAGSSRQVRPGGWGARSSCWNSTANR